ncbi:MAG: type I restriction endonuclease [Gammaproteobacteria bacterium]|nr:MAG: type I restriction endonuclease [Gammaproteobacteria bacterium]
MTNEADTCRKYVVPKLQAAGWDAEPHSIAEQRTITDGRVIPVGKGFVRKPPKRVDYLLRYTRDFPLAVVEAKASYKTATDAVQQARAYAEMLDLKYAYATNGTDIIEIDYFTGSETRLTEFPKPEDLWQRYQTGSGIKAPDKIDGFYPDSADTFTKAHTEPKECPCRSASTTALSTSGNSSSWFGDPSRAAGRLPWRSASTRTC